jgi:hypothetical protein
MECEEKLLMNNRPKRMMGTLCLGTLDTWDFLLTKVGGKWWGQL